MRALVHDPDAPGSLRVGEARDPEPGPSEVLVDVAALLARRVRGKAVLEVAP